MRILLCCFLLLLNCAGFGQDSISLAQDSTPAQVLQSSQLQADSLYRAQSIDRMGENMQAFLRLQREREAKQRKQAIIRLAIGVLFLVVLIIGWRRKKKG